MSRKRREIDKSDWGDGPWQTEPDEASWSFGDVPCRIVRNPHSGTWNGYVAGPPSHPWFGKRYEEVDRSEEYLSFAGPFTETTFASATGEGLWWLGFDCDHSFYDFAPGRLAWERRNNIEPMPDFDGITPEYRTEADARHRAEKFAREAIAAMRERVPGRGPV